MIDITITITADEWREIAVSLWPSLGTREGDPLGHLLLECDGRERTWIATDGVQLTAHTSYGDAPRGVDNPEGRFAVAINPRLFRSRQPQDATLVVTPHGERRSVRLVVDDVSAELPEHPGERPDWREPFEGLHGVTASIDTRRLIDALIAAASAPLGSDGPEIIGARLWFAESRLHIETAWHDLPASSITVPAETDESTEPLMFDLRRLRRLLEPIELPTTELSLPTDGSGLLAVRAGDHLAGLMRLDPLGQHRRHLEELLAQLLDNEPTQDDDGDYPITAQGDIRIYTRLVNPDFPTVQVFSVLAGHVEPSPGLYEEINAINASAPFVKLVHAAGAVMVEIDLVAESLDLPELHNALDTVRHTAHTYRDLLASFFSSTLAPEGGADPGAE